MDFTPATFLDVGTSLCASISATTNGTAWDSNDYRHALVVYSAATFTGTSPTCTVKVQESDTSGGTYTDVSSAAFTQTTTASDDSTVIGRIELAGRKRYLRAVATVGGTTPVCPIAVNFVGIQPSNSAQADTSFAFSV